MAFTECRRSKEKTMKVIKYGSIRITKCMRCKSVLEYEKLDIQTRKTGINEYEKYIICPVCKQPRSIGDYENA